MITKLKINMVWDTKFLAMERRLKQKLDFVILELVAVVVVVLFLLQSQIIKAKSKIEIYIYLFTALATFML